MNDGNESPWMQTMPSGTKLYFLQPVTEDIVITDIAHHLSLICRFTGGTPHLYSVALHSILMSMIAEDLIHHHEDLSRDLPLQALFHDAGEMVVSDVPRPVKACVPAIKEIEDKFLSALWKKLGVDPIDDSVKCDLDIMMLSLEHEKWMDMGNGWEEWIRETRFNDTPLSEGTAVAIHALMGKIGSIRPAAVEAGFIKRYEYLTKKGNQ